MKAPMQRLIDSLLESSTWTKDDPIIMFVSKPPGNARPSFLECQVVLKTGYAAAGVLTNGDHDTLRLLAPAKKPDGSTIIADHYFDYDDVLTIVVGRDLPTVAPSLIIGH